MGLFDWLRGKPSQVAPEADDPSPEPRMDHYVFAHYALRSVALADPLQCLAILASERGTRFLYDLLKAVTEEEGPTGGQPRFRADEFDVVPTRFGDYPGVVIAMPRPRAITEAHFVALVLLDDLSDPDAVHEHIPARYFTLEKGMSLDASPRTVLCEWTATGQHANFGTGPEPTTEAFTAAITQRIERG